MLHPLPAWMRGSLAFLLFVLNTLFWAPLLLLTAFLRLALPFPRFVRLCRRTATRIAANWIAGNVAGLKASGRIAWDVAGLEELRGDAWYAVTCNHRSWVDIVVVQWLFNRRIPMLKFFLKKELIRVPVLGWCWWALEFPFMKRYPRELLEARPDLRGKDLATTRQACERFRDLPTSVLNFLEGTRFSEAKRQRQGSPYRHLLLPRAGGLAQVVSSLGHRLDALLDVTIVYPAGTPTFWDLVSGRIPRVAVRVERVALDPSWTGASYDGDAAFREGFQAFVSDLWRRKDERIDALLAGRAAG